MKQYLLILLLGVCLTTFGQSGDFVQVENARFILNGEPYRFIGTNFWYGMNLGQAARGRLVRELDQLKELGISNLRIMAASEGAEDSPYQNKPILQTAPGQYNESLLEGLDFLLVEMGKRDMKAVVCLGNFWMWSGGFPQYISWVEGNDIPYPDVLNGSSWDDFINYSQSFYGNRKAVKMYFDYLKFIIGRVNSISGVAYKEDPTIMSWQLANEPRGYDEVNKYRRWIRRSARRLQRWDRNHLVCLGAEGDTSTPISGTDLYEDNKSRHIDYATTHLWIQNWGWFDPENPTTFESAMNKAQDYIDGQLAKARTLNKPLVLEEFGVSRDNGSFESDSDVAYRNQFYRWAFQVTLEQIQSNGILQGCNFWSWGGEGRPANPGQLWEVGDDLIGDPAHELQGWYSVYDTDESTVELIKEYSSQID